MTQPKTIPNPNRSPQSHSAKSLPKNRMAFTPESSSLHIPALLNSLPKELTISQTKKAIEPHLVQQDDVKVSIPADISHNLVGGAITRDIYKWIETQEEPFSRTQSEPSLHNLTSSIRLPGGFRRHFIMRRAEERGSRPNLIARNFIDFLALYGNFAGGNVYPL